MLGAEEPRCCRTSECAFLTASSCSRTMLAKWKKPSPSSSACRRPRRLALHTRSPSVSMQKQAPWIFSVTYRGPQRVSGALRAAMTARPPAPRTMNCVFLMARCVAWSSCHWLVLSRILSYAWYAIVQRGGRVARASEERANDAPVALHTREEPRSMAERSEHTMNVGYCLDWGLFGRTIASCASRCL